MLVAMQSAHHFLFVPEQFRKAAVHKPESLISPPITISTKLHHNQHPITPQSALDCNIISTRLRKTGNTKDACYIVIIAEIT